MESKHALVSGCWQILFTVTSKDKINITTYTSDGISWTCLSNFDLPTEEARELWATARKCLFRTREFPVKPTPCTPAGDEEGLSVGYAFFLEKDLIRC